MSITRAVFLLFILLMPAFAFAGTYTTTVSPSGVSVSNPITATFNIQDFTQKDYPIPGSNCNASFVPAEIQFNYWFNQGTNSNTISPAVVPTSAMIESGIYSATFNLPVGQVVDAIGAEFFQIAGGGGTKCAFYGRQPNGAPVNWDDPIFTVIEKPAAPTRGGTAFQNREPSVDFVDFPKEKIWSGRKTIAYFAVDYDSAPYGLKDFPINFYLSNDGGAVWKELAKNEPNSGTYLFDSNNFPDGANYKLKIIASDSANKAGEVISETFSIDNTTPIFEISIVSKSDAIREKDKISIKISSSENLIEAPKIQIIQSGADPQPLVVGGFGKNFSATYTVLKGHLGQAFIEIKGKDLAGNVGKEISSGETFTVSRLGPPPPVIKNMADNESFDESKIDILGSAPLAEEVIFVFNGNKFTIKPDEDGSFSFKDVVLSSLNFGRNTLSFSSTDKNGIESDARILTVKLNNPPSLSWISRPGGLVSGKIKLEWKADDLNNDELIYSLWYSVDGGKNWDYFSKGLLENKYDLNTSEFFDGDGYLIKVTADDGAAKAEIVSEKLIFRNNNSFSVSGAPRNYIFDTTKPVFKGDIKISENKIVSLRYSLEKEEWLKIEAGDGKFDSFSEKYSIKFPDPFVDGRHILFIEAEDDSGRVLKTFQQFIIDTMLPVEPKINFPSADTVVNNSDDNDAKLGGIQANVSGMAEAGADLEFVVNSRTYLTTAKSRGDFEFTNVTFLSHGINRYFLSSTDSAGNISKIEGFLVSNNAPRISLLTPQAGDFLSGTGQIKWRASDEDGDPLVYQILYRRKNKNWIVVSQNLTISEFDFDASKFPEGEYELKIIANDGLSEASAAVEKIFIDNIMPTINFDIAGPIYASRVNLLFSGSAGDNLSGIKFVEYSLDGKTWFKALIAEGYLQKKAVFVVRHPFELEDGEYNFGVRSIDAAGNISKPKFEKIVVDSTPPRIGSFIISYGGISILPDQNVFTVIESAPLHFVISLEDDTQNAFLVFGGKRLELVKNKSTGLWEADILIDKTGTSTMSVLAEDFLENRTVGKVIGAVAAIPRGQTLPDAKITVFTRNIEDQSLTFWPADAYGLENPIFSDEDGKYLLLLPSGKYQLLIEKSGHQRLRVSDFEVLNPRFINFDFELKPRKGLRGRIEDILEKFLEIF